MSRKEETYERFRNPSSVERSFIGNPPNAMVQQTGIFSKARGVNARKTYMNKLYAFGIAECLLGGLSIILGITSLTIEHEIRPFVTGLENLFTYTAQGIWDGLFIVVTGILGIRAKANPSLLIYNANMAMCIITAVLSAAGIVLSGFASTVSAVSDSLTLFTIHVSISLLLFTGLIIVIVHSGFCCAGVCRTEYDEGAVVYITQVPQSHQVVGLQSVQDVRPSV